MSSSINADILRILFLKRLPQGLHVIKACSSPEKFPMYKETVLSPREDIQKVTFMINTRNIGLSQTLCFLLKETVAQTLKSVYTGQINCML